MTEMSKKIFYENRKKLLLLLSIENQMIVHVNLFTLF